MAVETEIKFEVGSIPRLEERLQQAGFRLVTPASLERNTLYDTPARILRGRRAILRLREYRGRWLLTHKSIPTDGEGEGLVHKRRVELETFVEDGASMAEILSTLGYEPAFRYEKWRAEWAEGPGHCVIDETPIGVFGELEGPAGWIDAMAPKLDLAADRFIRLSYGRMFEEWKERTGSQAANLTFAEIPSSARPAAVHG
jgi:adenylate cyclase class 2